MKRSPDNREIIFETTRCGNQIKVSAIDVITGIEVSIIAPKNASKLDTQTIARRKLAKRLAQDNPKPASDSSGDKGGGIIV